MTRSGYIGWLLPEMERNRLRAVFPASHAVDDTIQHHITHIFGVRDDHPLPAERHGAIVGHVDRDGVQALVVKIADSVHRPDGGIYHVTWSLDRAAGRKPNDSNKVLRTGWQPVSALEITIEPSFFAF